MEKKGKETIVNLIEAGETLISGDISPMLSNEINGLNVMVYALLDIAKEFISDPDALEAVNAIAENREDCLELLDNFHGPRVREKENYKVFLLYDKLKALKRQMNEK